MGKNRPRRFQCRFLVSGGQRPELGVQQTWVQAPERASPVWGRQRDPPSLLAHRDFSWSQGSARCKDPQQGGLRGWNAAAVRTRRPLCPDSSGSEARALRVFTVLTRRRRRVWKRMWVFHEVAPLLPVCPPGQGLLNPGMSYGPRHLQTRNVGSYGQRLAGPPAFLEEWHLWGSLLRVASTLLGATFLWAAPGAPRRLSELVKGLRRGLGRAAPGQASHPKSGATALRGDGD